jgi:hypothetical protein
VRELRIVRLNAIRSATGSNPGEDAHEEIVVRYILSVDVSLLFQREREREREREKEKKKKKTK